MEEYLCFSRGFDIGNHFSEWVNDYNYPHYPYFIGDMNKYPSHDQKVIKRYFVFCTSICIGLYIFDVFVFEVIHIVQYRSRIS